MATRTSSTRGSTRRGSSVQRSINSSGAPSQITSASQLASRPTEWAEWARAVNLNPTIITRIPEDPKFQPLHDIEKASFSFPRWMSSTDSPQFRYINSPRHHLRDKLCRWLRDHASQEPQTTPSGQPMILVHDDHDPLLAAAVPRLLDISHSHLRLAKISGFQPNEAYSRSAGDELMAYVCNEGDETDPLWHSREHALRLPETNLSHVRVESTQSDAADLIIIPALDSFNGSLRMQQAVSALASQPDQLVLVHCVAEFKRQGNGRGQALMGLVSGIYQRKMLGLDPQFVFGVIHTRRHFFELVAGIWLDGEIKVYSIAIYSFLVPHQVVQFYLALRATKKLAARYRDNIIERDSELADAFAKQSPELLWMPAKPKSRQLGTVMEEQLDPHGAGFQHIQDSLQSWDFTSRISWYLESLRPAAMSTTPKAGDPTDAASESSDEFSDILQSPPLGTSLEASGQTQSFSKIVPGGITQGGGDCVEETDYSEWPHLVSRDAFQDSLM